MPYVPGFAYDLFISYASQDNHDGWVEKFQKQLTDELVRLLGRPFSERSIFFDRLRLEVGQDYPEILDEASRESALLVILLSPNYVTSDWCSRERQVFQEKLAPGGTVAECRVVCRLRPTGALPAALASAQHADFVIPGFQEPWPPGSGKWIEAVNRLAVPMKNILQNLRSRAGAVFVGAPLNRQMSLREDLADYLSKQHFRATPDPSALLEDRAACHQALAEAQCAVHFLGGSSQTALDRIEDSINQCPGPTILFQPFGASLTAAEEFFLSSLPAERYPDRLGPNETELKKFLEDLLTRRRLSAEAAAASLGLVCDLPDFSWAQQFQAPGLSVNYPRFLQNKLSTSDRLRSWRQLLKDSHGLLFYQGRSPEPFLKMLEKLAVEEKSVAVRRWYLDDPDIETKREKHPSDPIYPVGLEEFLEDIRRRVSKSKGEEA